MAAQVVVGLAPESGGVLEITVSASGLDQLTLVELDTDSRLLTFDPNADVRLQFVGVEGAAVDVTRSNLIRTGGLTEVDAPGWGPLGARFFLAGPVGAKCTVTAQRRST